MHNLLREDWCQNVQHCVVIDPLSGVESEKNSYIEIKGARKQNTWTPHSAGARKKMFFYQTKRMFRSLFDAPVDYQDVVQTTRVYVVRALLPLCVDLVRFVYFVGVLGRCRVILLITNSVFSVFVWYGSN